MNIYDMRMRLYNDQHVTNRTDEVYFSSTVNNFPKMIENAIDKQSQQKNKNNNR